MLLSLLVNLSSSVMIKVSPQAEDMQQHWRHCWLRAGVYQHLEQMHYRGVILVASSAFLKVKFACGMVRGY